MAGKRKGKKKGGGKAKKKPKTTDLWCKQDLDFDENGCLEIKNEYLGRAIQQAIYDTSHRFCITIDDPNAPGQKINAMCPC